MGYRPIFVEQFRSSFYSLGCLRRQTVFFFQVFGRALDIFMSANEIPTRFAGQFHFDFVILAARYNTQLLLPLACTTNELRFQPPAVERKNPGSSPDVPGSPPDVHDVMLTVDLPSPRSLPY